MLTVVGLLACGVLVGRLRVLPDGAADVLDRVVITLALPGLVLARISTLAMDPSTLVPIAVAWAQLVLLVGVVLLLGRALSWPRRTVGTMLLCVPLGNTSFLGFPAVEALLGADHVGHAIVYDQLGTFLALATWGTVVAARYGAGASASARAVARRVLTFPAFVALVVALVARWTGLPGPVMAIAESLGSTLTPLAMIAIGLRLRLPERASAGPLAIGLGLRMVVAPLAVLAVAAVIGGTGTAWRASTLEAAMPPMITAGVMATAAGLDERLAVGLTGGGILLALVTLPAVASVVG